MLFALVALLALGCISKNVEPAQGTDSTVPEQPGNADASPGAVAEEPPQETEAPPGEVNESQETEAIVDNISEDNDTGDVLDDNGTTGEIIDRINTTLNGITRQMCIDAGGHWLACGSDCRGDTEATSCIAACIPYCECGGIAGFDCPAGYSCTDYLPKNAADVMGICKKVSQ